MKKCLFTTLIFLGVVFFSPLGAQSQFTGWLASFNTFKTGKKTSIHADVQLRSTDEIQKIQTLLLRPGFNYHLNKKMVLTAGYAFISNRRIVGTVSDLVPEHRVWEQLLITHSIKKIPISHRFRIEQRFLANTVVQGNELETDGFVMAGRFRYFIRSIIPFQQTPSFNKGFFGALQNEVFVNVGNKANVNGEFFDQNRAYLAAGYRLHPKADLEIGYMNQYVNGRGSQFTKNHILQLAGYLRL